MSRLTMITPDEATGRTKELFDKAKKKMGKVPNILRGMGNSPAVLEGYLNLSGALASGSLSTELREKIALLTAQENGCDYCLAAHSAIADGAGLEQDAILQARKGEADDAREQSALTFANAVLNKKGWVEDADIAAARKAGFDDGEIAEIVANVVLNMYTNYFNHLNSTDLDFPEAPELDA